MKHLKTLLLATVLCLTAVSFTQAQSKVAHINTQELIASMSEFKSAQAQLETLGKTYQADFKTMATAYDTKAKQYGAEEATKTAEENQKRALELQDLQKRIQEFQGTAQQDLGEKEKALIKPVQEKAIAAINKVAKAQGFNYVLDRASLIVADGKDIMADVKKELGI